MQGKVRIGDPGAIEQALNDLRRASLVTAGPGLPPVRATVLNLVGYASDQAAADRMAGWAASLAEQHPSRGIFLGAEPALGGADWDIWVSAHCHPAGFGYVVCFEAVQIMARHDSLERLPAIALPLLLRDLPVVLWWPGDPPIGTALFGRLLANSDHLVVDTASASRPEELLRRLIALGHAEHCVCSSGDMNWDRLTPWRELVAQFFDPPDCRPCLDRLERVRLESAVPPGHADRAQAYLLAGWLATRLGWAPAPEVWSEAEGAERAGFLRGRQRVTVEFADAPAAEAGWSHPEAGRPGEEPGSVAPSAGLQGLCCLRLHARHPEGPATFTIRRTADGARAEVTTQLPNREARWRVVPFATPGPAELLGEELRRIGYDRTYAEALRMAAYLSAERLATRTPQGVAGARG